MCRTDLLLIALVLQNKFTCYSEVPTQLKSDKILCRAIEELYNKDVSCN